MERAFIIAFMYLNSILKNVLVVNSSTNIDRKRMNTKQKKFTKILDTKKKLYFESKMLLEKIEINSHLNIDNEYYVYKYFELQKKYVQIEKKLDQLSEELNSEKNI